MLTDKDRTSLQRIVGKQGMTTQVILAIMVPVQIGLAAIKFQLAHLWADLAGISMGRLISVWFAGVDAGVRYPGTLIRAEDDLQTGLMLLGLAAMFAIAWWTGRTRRETTQRIITSLKSSGAW